MRFGRKERVKLRLDYWLNIFRTREELREAAKRARAYLWDADDGEGLDEQLKTALLNADEADRADTYHE